MNQMIRQGVMFTTGRYGMETDHFPNTGNSFSGIYQNLDSNHFPVKRQLIHLQMIRQTGIFQLCDGKTPEKLTAPMEKS